MFVDIGCLPKSSVTLCETDVVRCVGTPKICVACLHVICALEALFLQCDKKWSRQPASWPLHVTYDSPYLKCFYRSVERETFDCTVILNYVGSIGLRIHLTALYFLSMASLYYLYGDKIYIYERSIVHVNQTKGKFKHLSPILFNILFILWNFTACEISFPKPGTPLNGQAWNLILSLSLLVNGGFFLWFQGSKLNRLWA